MARIKKNVRNAANWYTDKKPLYDDLVSNVREVIRSMLAAEGIAFVDVQGRAKSVASFTDKISRKTYSRPEEEITDLAGLRVITLIETDISKVERIISSAFQVHADSSVDKSHALGADRVGYRSLHLICDLGEDRLKLPEFKRYKNCKFEVQIRTSLQHAWAEIEHDRGYKLSGTLPSHLKRKFSLLAGLLELADAQFDELSQAIDLYTAEVVSKASKGDLGIELNSSSIRELLMLKFGDSVKDSYPELWPTLIKELNDFGIEDLQGLDKLITSDLIPLMTEGNTDLYMPGLVRDSMLLNDIEKYMRASWNRNWTAIDDNSHEVLCKKYGPEAVKEIMDRHDINLYSEPDESDDDYSDVSWVEP